MSASDVLDEIIAFESGNLDADATVDLFAELVKSGDAWKLQGSYGRTAAAIIGAGYLTDTGDVVRYPSEDA